MNTKSIDRLAEIDRRAAIIIALPLSLFGLLVAGIAGFLLIIGGPSQVANLKSDFPWHNLAIAVSMISLLALLYAAISAIRNRLAVWSYTWSGALMVGLVVSLNLVLDDRFFAFSKLIDFTIVMLVLLSYLVIIGYVFLQGWQHTGLLSIGICGMLGLALVFFGISGSGPFHPSLGLLSLVLGLIEACIVYVYLCNRSTVVRVLLVIAIGCLNIGIAWIIESIFRSSDSSRDISQFLILAALLTGLLFGGTISGVFGHLVQRKFGLLKSN